MDYEGIKSEQVGDSSRILPVINELTNNLSNNTNSRKQQQQQQPTNNSDPLCRATLCAVPKPHQGAIVIKQQHPRFALQDREHAAAVGDVLTFGHEAVGERSLAYAPSDLVQLDDERQQDALGTAVLGADQPPEVAQRPVLVGGAHGGAEERPAVVVRPRGGATDGVC